MATRQWYVGVDWATEQHQICVLDGDGKVVVERQVAHTGEGIAGLCGWLHELSGGHPASVHAAIEVPHGAVVEMLLERDVQVYAINPKQLDRFRDRFSASGAKDDRRDARVLADSLRTDGRSFRQVQVQSPQVIELRECSRMAEELQQDRNRLTNRLREQLRRYYPQMVELGKGNNGVAGQRRIPQPANQHFRSAPSDDAGVVGKSGAGGHRVGVLLDESASCRYGCLRLPCAPGGLPSYHFAWWDAPQEATWRSRTPGGRYGRLIPRFGPLRCTPCGP